ncbi:phosphotransferase [Streptomyces dysideae]|uniref:Aminoglycoside phosphotransferase n=1 Tax=Streptomyces dysideae TaxID=909626 RepID=A0A101V1M4_9ACTN|nr:phosphotransferase [Streptomyces dysideae]KUO20778.1 aminoglycoside phosphotransferase [Streptomyces dysideae]
MITAYDDPRMELARQTVGAVRIVADPALPPHLLHLVDVRGNAYFAKQHANRNRYVHEAHAYLTWGRHLQGHAPELVGRQDSTRTLLLTAIRGQSGDDLPPGSAEEEEAHHNAGLVLGALHRATAGPKTGGIGVELAGRLRGWVDRADRADLLSTDERRSLLQVADLLSHVQAESAVCHLDYQPRNWLIGDGFWICDFEHMRRDARIRDFARLEFRRWQAAPHLRSAFFAAYGRELSDAEQHLLESFGAIEAATALVRGHEQDDLALSAHGRTVLARLS